MQNRLQLSLGEWCLTPLSKCSIRYIITAAISGVQGYTAFMRHVLNITKEERQQRREQVLSTTLKDFRCCFYL